jgi:hypothetical protein
METNLCLFLLSFFLFLLILARLFSKELLHQKKQPRSESGILEQKESLPKPKAVNELERISQTEVNLVRWSRCGI